ncbi:hypothetical protein [Clostridium sp.]|uniref:hypothetical protein n=1 Tax=Clostridium sp. TaxID=1506 RepID=UPI0039F5DCED
MTEANISMSSKSYFDGTLLQYVGWSLIGIIVTVCTLGICYPWALCKLYGWKINHTVVEGRRLRFDGKAVQLFGNWIKWWLLCLITLGIYSFLIILFLVYIKNNLKRKTL